MQMGGSQSSNGYETYTDIQLDAKVVDLDAVIKLWCEQTIKQSIKVDDTRQPLRYEIDWSKVKIEHEPARFADVFYPPSLTQQVLFKTVYENKSDTN